MSDQQHWRRIQRNSLLYGCILAAGIQCSRQSGQISLFSYVRKQWCPGPPRIVSASPDYSPDRQWNGRDSWSVHKPLQVPLEGRHPPWQLA